ncbi:MAG TPA: HEAT repeat domain-containing protein [Candidatus Poseidoniales archaeon]|nr:MAG TPA: HEAT repeat domain-containing protein [Candidatus Poseidoniales archaeon]HII62981.1 HEAT repeat domain-containing protein [Candidatus Poseidoniaceae archaeon]
MKDQIDSLAVIIETGSTKDARAAITSLTSCEDKPKVFELLISYLKHNSLYIRGDAAKKLGSFTEYQGAILPLIEALGDEEDWVVTNAANTLGYFKDERAVEPLFMLFFREDDPTRMRHYYARESLIAIGGEKVVEFALKDMKSESPNRNTILLLGDLAEERAIESLIARLDKMCSTSVYSLSKIGGDKASKALQRSLHKVLIHGSTHGYKIELINALARLEYDESIETIIKALKVRNEDVKISAIQALGKFGGDRSIEALKRLRKNKSKKVKQAVNKLLD